jgi:cullin-associated NEDD8-dissociated protein 1
MDIAFPQLNSRELLDRVLAGLEDEHDIKMLCNLMIAKLINLDPDEVTQSLSAIAERYAAILKTTLKDNAVKQEREKVREANNDVLRISARLNNSPKINTHGQARWNDYWDTISRDFKVQLQTVEAEIREERQQACI